MMDYASDSAHIRPTTAAVGAAPLAVAGAVAVTALVAYVSRPARRSSEAAEKHQSLVSYLRDHLSGADAAIHIVRRLASTHEHTPDVCDDGDRPRGLRDHVAPRRNTRHRDRVVRSG